MSILNILKDFEAVEAAGGQVQGAASNAFNELRDNAVQWLRSDTTPVPEHAADAWLKTLKADEADWLKDAVADGRLLDKNGHALTMQDCVLQKNTKSGKAGDMKSGLFPQAYITAKSTIANGIREQVALDGKGKTEIEKEVAKKRKDRKLNDPVMAKKEFEKSVKSLYTKYQKLPAILQTSAHDLIKSTFGV